MLACSPSLFRPCEMDLAYAVGARSSSFPTRVCNTSPMATELFDAGAPAQFSSPTKPKKPTASDLCRRSQSLCARTKAVLYWTHRSRQGGSNRSAVDQFLHLDEYLTDGQRMPARKIEIRMRRLLGEGTMLQADARPLSCSHGPRIGLEPACIIHRDVGPLSSSSHDHEHHLHLVVADQAQSFAPGPTWLASFALVSVILESRKNRALCAAMAKVRLRCGRVAKPQTAPIASKAVAQSAA